MPTTKDNTLSLHDALPISSIETRSPTADNGTGVASRGVEGYARTRDLGRRAGSERGAQRRAVARRAGPRTDPARDRKSTRLNSSHPSISYADFCLKKNKSV